MVKNPHKTMDEVAASDASKLLKKLANKQRLKQTEIKRLREYLKKIN